MESSLKLTTIKLVSLANQECQVLKHSGQWVSTPSIVAMQAMLHSTTLGTAKVFEQLTVNLSKLSGNHNLNPNGQGWHREASSGNGQRHQEDQHRHYMSDSPDWVYEKPNEAHETRTYRGRIWSFCPKCGHNGKWVCTHTATTHRSSEFLQRNLSTTMMMALQKEVGPVTGVLEVLMIDGHNTIIGNKLILTLELHHPVQDRLYIVGVTVYLLKTHHLLVLMLNFHFMTK